MYFLDKRLTPVYLSQRRVHERNKIILNNQYLIHLSVDLIRIRNILVIGLS